MNATSDLLDTVTDLLDAVELPEGIVYDLDELTDDDGDEVVTGYVVRLYGLPGIGWGDEVEDLIDLTPAGLVFSGDAGGLGGPCSVRGTTYGGGTYQRWEVAE